MTEVYFERISSISMSSNAILIGFCPGHEEKYLTSNCRIELGVYLL